MNRTEYLASLGRDIAFSAPDSNRPSPGGWRKHASSRKHASQSLLWRVVPKGRLFGVCERSRTPTGMAWQSLGVLVVVLGAIVFAGMFLLERPEPRPSSIEDLGVSSSAGPGTDQHPDRLLSFSEREADTTRLPVAAFVTGAVRSPGVYYFPEGLRVVDALEAAGGASPEADVSKLNLAAPLEDGVRIYVPRVGEDLSQEMADAGVVSTSGSDGSKASSPPGDRHLKVNINRAPVSELEKLPGIGTTLAERIVEDRTRNGPYKKAQDLARVPGIGDAKIAQIVPFIAF